MDKKKSLKLLKVFKNNLGREISIKKMYLFGSRAKGNAKRWSDFDLLIVSSMFWHKETYERALGFRKYWNFDYPVDFLCYTPEEFNKLKKQVSIVKEAIENGIEI